MSKLDPAIPTSASINGAITDIHSITGADCQIFWDDTQTLFYPIFPCIEKALTITEKSLECNKETRFVRKTMYRSRELFAKVPRGGKVIGVTFQGFMKDIVRALTLDGKTFDVRDLRLANSKRKDFPEPRLDLMGGFRFSQEELLTKFLLANQSGLIGAPTRWGKCLGVDTKVLMYDYSIKKVQDIVIGDLLMGPDGLPRKVVALGRGREQSYRVIPNKGESFKCNESHILSLKVTGGAKMGGWSKGDIVNIRIKDYIGRSKTFKHVTKLWWAPIEFSEANLPVDPWVVGVWIGDGATAGTARLTKPDRDVQNGLKEWADKNGYLFKLVKDSTENDTVKINIPFSMLPDSVRGRRDTDGISAFRQIKDICVVDGEKRIPIEYLTASLEQRLELLAGLIDTDGYNNNDLGYEIVTKYDGLSEDIMRLCRGLGFRCTRNYVQKTIKSLGFAGWYWRIQISGHLEDIPCRGHKKITSMSHRVDPMTSGFTLEDIGEQDYYGFELEGPDKLFLLWDHLVTHNTTLILNTLKAFPTLNTVVTAPGVDLVRQLYCDITGPRGVKNREVKLICSGSRTKYPSQEDGGITVCSADSLHLCDMGATELLLADEPHSLVTSSRLSLIDGFLKARRYGYGATLKGRFDGRDKLITGVFGPVIIERTYQEAVTEGAICPLNIILLQIQLDAHEYYTRDTAYAELLFESPEMANITRRICDEVIPRDWQTMIFIKNEKQAELYLNAIGTEHTIAMAKRMTKSEREEINRRMKANEIKRCLCTDIYVQGVTFSDARVLINAEAGGNNTTAIQKPGRLAEIRPGKKCGIVIDFEFTSKDGTRMVDYSGDQTAALMADSKSRIKAYTDKGYGIYKVKSIEEMKTTFDSLI